uniref:Alkylated DNA repair protein AlkB homologue 8 N-terminal domain-containing protein n=1 Tax=Graphocephala atropunctata TaxID=36148 RepID=A0A1B6M6W0_9HEMI
MKPTEYLGVIIDNKLTWTPHIDQLIKKLSSNTYVIRRIKNISNMDTAKTAYFSLFESHLRYGIIIWGNSSHYNLQRVLVAQKKVIRILADLNPLDSCRAAFLELKILTVVSLYIYEVICFAMSHNLTRLGETHPYNTRNANNFALPIHHLALSEEKPSYMRSKLYNLLPNHLKAITDVRHFKKEARQWLLERTFYTIEEFLNWKT